MEDDNLILLLNSNASPTSHSATPIQNRREPLVDIVENDANDSIVTMTCLNDRIPSLPPSNGKRHFEDIKLVRPTSATSQGSRTKKAGKTISYAPHLTSGGNRNSTDNLIQSSIDVTLSSESSRDDQALRARPGPIPNDDELGIVTIFGAEDNGERENEYPTDNNNAAAHQSTPITSSKVSMPSQVHSTPDVQISRFDKDASTSKTAFARSQLAKRFLVNRAQQRSVPIQSLSNTSNTHEFSTNSTDPQATTSLTATLAASVAISVAQPFLKLQNDLEQKMNSVLDQIQQQQQRANTGGFVVPVTAVPHPSAATADSSKLLTDCVDNRMKYMEKVQEQQQQVLKQLVDMVNTTKPSSQSPGRGYKSSKDVEASHALSPPPQQYHFLDSLVGSSSPPVRLTKSPKKHSTHKRTSTSPSAQKRPSRVTATRTRTTKARSPVTFKQQPPNSRFNIEPASPFDCSVCDRSRSRSRSRSPTKGLSPDSSYPRPFAPVPRPASIMSDGFIPRSASPFAGNALTETYAPFDKYLNNFIPPSPLEPKPARVNDENVDLHERIKQIDEARHLLDENYLTLQRRKNDTALLHPTTNDSSRIQRLVEQCVKQVTRQVREEVKVKLEQEESQDQEKKTVVNAKKRPTSRTHLAFDRHSTTRAGKQSLPESEPSGPAKPYSDAFMEAIYGRSLYQKIKKDGKQPYFKLKGQPVQRAKQPKQIEQIPVRDTGLKVPPTSVALPAPRVIQPALPAPQPALPAYEPEYYRYPDGVILLGPPQIRDTRTFQPIYGPSATKLTPHVLPSVDVDPSAKKVRFGHKTESIKVDLDDDDDDDDDGHGIEIPGYHGAKDAQQQTYDGPRFPPTIPHDEGYRNRQYDSLQSGAIDWLEQELIARFMSQLQNQQTTIPVRQHRDVISARSSTSSSSDDRSLHDRLLDLLGQDGFRLFIDMGQPIDQDLIQALTREVLEERIAQMIGFRSPRESIQLIPPPPAPPPRTMTPTTATVVEHHPWPHDNSVPTPQPTPPHSPPPPVRPPRVATPEITGQEVSSDSDMSTPRSVTPQEDLDRPMPGVHHRSVGTPDPSNSPSPPSTPRAPRLPSPPRAIATRDASTMASIELPPPPPPVIIQPIRVPSPPPAPRPPPKAKTPSPVSSTSSSSSSSSLSSSSLSTTTPAYSSHSSTFSDHQWLDLRSEGQIDPLGYDRPRTELIMKHAQLLLEQRRRSSPTTAGLSFISPPTSPAGATHTLSIGEVPPQYPSASAVVPQQIQENGHTTPSGSDESNHSGKSEGEVNSSLMMGQQRQPIHIKYHRSTVLNRKKNGK